MAQSRMSRSSISSMPQMRQLPIIDCPGCRIRLIRLQSRQPDTWGKVFYKCVNHDRDDPESCRFFKTEDDYERYLRRVNRLPCQEPALDHVDPRQFLELKSEVLQLKNKIEQVEGAVAGSKRAFAVDLGCIVAACLGCVFGIIVVLLFKQ
ncbi:hypothetical protein EJB05_53618, partial [Eragrostis curvula]